MPSPFPGIDPYLESQDLWPDFHVRFTATLCDAISEQLPDPYVARIDERMNLVERPQEEVKRIRPDLAVVQQRPGRTAAETGQGTLTLEPVTNSLRFLEEYREVFIEILHWPNHKVVAVVELLAPGNKAGNTRRDYLVMRNGLMNHDVHLIELDFLVGGRRLPMEQPLPPEATITHSSRVPSVGPIAMCSHGRSATPCRPFRSLCSPLIAMSWSISRRCSPPSTSGRAITARSITAHP